AVERMRLGCNVSALAEELGVGRGTLYRWGEAEERSATGAEAMDAQQHRMKELESQVAQLQSELGRSSLENRFFQSALRRVEESRQSRSDDGETVSTRRFASGRKRKAN